MLLVVCACFAQAPLVFKRNYNRKKTKKITDIYVFPFPVGIVISVLVRGVGRQRGALYLVW